MKIMNTNKLNKENETVKHTCFVKPAALVGLALIFSNLIFRYEIIRESYLGSLVYSFLIFIFGIILFDMDYLIGNKE